MNCARRSFVLSLAFVLPLASASLAFGQEPECEKEYESTFELIQHEIFEKRGCTSSACHGQAASGGLDLRAGVAYDNLVDEPVTSVPVELYPDFKRVVPGRKDRSLLWLNLAGATLPELWTAPLRTMPLGLPPLSPEELEVIRIWIEEGATRDGILPQTGEILDACLPPPRPLRTEPLPPPVPGTGIQLRAPHQVLPPQSEREVCFISYYDFSGQVPEEFRGPGGDTFRFKRVDARQDPLSHHLVAIAYTGRASVHDPAWGEFSCRQGPRHGEPCDPTDLSGCGDGGICASEPRPAPGCVGFGPGDASIGVGEESLFNTMATTPSGIEGVYDEAPVRGIVVWNSHAFNLWDEPAHLDAWINFEFAAPEEQLRPLERFVDISAIAKMNPPAFGMDEVCHRYIVPEGVQLLDLSSHVHKRGKRFRIFQGDFRCDGGRYNGAPCSPFGPDPGLPLRDLCDGAVCQSRRPPAVGDCNRDLIISVDELVTGVNIALDALSMDACPRFDGNGDEEVSVDELLSAVNSALGPAWRDPQESLLYVSLTYVDPLVLSFTPPLELGGPGSAATERTLTYCALYDNGYLNPEEVKRRSTTPTNGFPCRPTHCAEGRVGTPCAGLTDHAACDSSPGAGDGLCDACAAGFGVSTDDEMFVLTGSYVSR